jgi:tRNA-intron endonuclease
MEILVKGKQILLNNKKISPYEALFLIEFSNAKCIKDKKEIGVFELIKTQKLNLEEYFFYRDLKLRGFNIILKNPKRQKRALKQIIFKHLKNLKKNQINFKFKGFFAGFTTIIEDEKIAKTLFEKFWFGQYATYKLPHLGKFNKLDIFETCFLVEKKKLKLDISKEALFKKAKSKIPNFFELYQIFKDWRESGFVIKTGFKFGCDFRVYSNLKPDKNVHSKYVVHLLPKTEIGVTELSRAIRVAHSVRKKFILALPNAKPKKRKLYLIEKENKRYIATYLFEQGLVNLNEILFLVEEAEKIGVEPIVVIIDRETSATYYKLQKVKLKNSKFNYFEIDWVRL